MLKTIIAASAATLALIGTAALATQPVPDASPVHQMTILLPSGGVERITYTGDAFAAPVFAAPSFAAFDRAAAQMDAMQMQMNAQMNAQMDAMLRQARAMLLAMPNANAPMTATFGGVPAGASGYSFIATAPGAQFCSRMVQIVTDTSGVQHVTQKTSGHCGAPAKPSAAPAPKSAI